METNLIPLGLDAGNGAFKLFGAQGGLEFISQVATNGSQKVLSSIGLRKSKAPLAIRNDYGSFYVGAGAHDYGRLIENLDAERLNNGTAEVKSVTQGLLTTYQKRYGLFTGPLLVTVGLPNEVMTGDQAEQNIENVKRWLRGTHTWVADGETFSVEIADVKTASQVTGGLFDYLLDETGQFISERRSAFNSEVGVISVGFGTVEMMVVRNREMSQRFTAGAASGVRRLLEIVNSQRLYSLGELDMQLRAGQLDIRGALPIWEREVMGVIEKQWGSAWKRFAAVLIMGGGALLLKDSLLGRFNGRAFMPDEPVLAIARGLYRLTLLQQGKKGK